MSRDHSKSGSCQIRWRRGLILVRGAVPGSKGGIVYISDAVKRPLPEGVPLPAAILKSPGAEEADIEVAVVEEASAERSSSENVATKLRPGRKD